MAANGSVKAKQLAAQLIPKFFKFFPQLVEQALDQHFNLIEDQELGVSILSIHGFCVLPLNRFQFSNYSTWINGISLDKRLHFFH